MYKQDRTLKVTFERSKVFNDIIFSKQIPNYVIIENKQTSKPTYYIKKGKINDKDQTAELSKNIIKSYCGLPEAKIGLQNLLKINKEKGYSLSFERREKEELLKKQQALYDSLAKHQSVSISLDEIEDLEAKIRAKWGL